jgi:hypothetical protein
MLLRAAVPVIFVSLSVPENGQNGRQSDRNRYEDADAADNSKKRTAALRSSGLGDLGGDGRRGRQAP